MPSAFTPNKSVEQPPNNADVDDWDVPVNANWAIIDTAFGGHTNLNATSVSGTVTLTLTQYQPPIIIITGTLTAAVNYQLPSGVGGVWSVFNNTTGAFNITFSSAGGGTTVTLLQGYTTSVISDGTNVGPDQTAPINPGGLTTQVQYNNGGFLAGSPNLTFTGSVLGLTGTFRFVGASSGYVGFIASATSTPTIWTLPTADGTNGQVLSTNGSAVLSWVTASGGGGGISTFNGRSGPAITLLSSDVTGALTYTPVNPAAFANFTAGANITPATTIATNAIGYLGLPQQTHSANYTGVMADAGMEEFFTASGHTGTLPSNASVAYPIGTVKVWSIASGTLTVAITSDTLTLVPTGTTGSRTVTGPGFLVTRKISATGWWCWGLGVS